MQPLKAAVLLRPMPPLWFATLALLVLIMGAAYCSGYEALVSGRMDWPGSLIWSAYAVLSWLLLFEWIKRREWDGDRPLSPAGIAALLLAVAAASILTEILHKEWVLGRDSPPLALQAMRRLPAMAAMVMLLMLSRREQEKARRRMSSPRDAAEAEAETLRRHAPAIRWIQAADNYLELHLDGQVWTRRITMRDAAEILEPLGFVRVHRSVIVNRSHVERIVPQSGTPAVKMTGGPALPTGRAFSGNLRQLH